LYNSGASGLVHIDEVAIYILIFSYFTDFKDIFFLINFGTMLILCQYSENSDFTCQSVILHFINWYSTN